MALTTMLREGYAAMDIPHCSKMKHWVARGMLRIGGCSYPPALKAIRGAGYAARYLGQYMPVKKAIT